MTRGRTLLQWCEAVYLFGTCIEIVLVPILLGFSYGKATDLSHDIHVSMTCKWVNVILYLNKTLENSTHPF